MIVKTDPRYWDCDCDNNYIHKKSITLKCEACNSEEDECSDSRPNEIKIYYKNYKEQK
jgi:Zn finger protein HypA/HybF involved in hydrogenase expression